MNLVVCRTSLATSARSSYLQKRLGMGCRECLLMRLSVSEPLLFNVPELTGLLVRTYSNSSRRPNFFTQFLENIKQDLQKNSEMKESLKKFREEAEKLEQSEALRSARQKFHTVESEATKSRAVLKEQLGSLKEKVQDVIEEASKSGLGKKAGQLGEEITKSAKGAAETITEKSQALGKSGAFQMISQTAEVVKKELDHQGMQGRVYTSPKRLRKRKEIATETIVQPNLEATGVELHKDSKFYESWQNFKENNPYVNKIVDWKMKYDESDNPVIRASRMFTDTVTDIVGGMFQKTNLSKALTEICKVDPNFDKTKFIRDCETDIIPNVLESMVKGNLDILQDWCYEVPYKIISQSLEIKRKNGWFEDGKILDIDNVDLVAGYVVEQGPVLVVTFQSQQIMCTRDSNANVIEGDPEKVLRVNHAWALCRDLTELNPKAAWRLLEFNFSCTEQLV